MKLVLATKKDHRSSVTRQNLAKSGTAEVLRHTGSQNPGQTAIWGGGGLLLDVPLGDADEECQAGELAGDGRTVLYQVSKDTAALAYRSSTSWSICTPGKAASTARAASNCWHITRDSTCTALTGQEF